MKLCSSILGAALLAASTFSFAQAPAPSAPTDQQKMERREKMKAAHDEAMKACQGKQGDERHQCMTQSMCAKAPNPQQCQERAKQREGKMHERHEKMKAARSKAEEACKGKEGPDRRSCMQQQMCAQAPDPAKCQAESKARMEKREQMRGTK